MKGLSRQGADPSALSTGKGLEVAHDLFETANGRPLGNIVQSMTVHQDKAFIVVNNSNKIEVVNLDDFKSVTTIENLTLPRYFIGFDEDKGYVSCWDSTVKVMNLRDYSIITSIQTGNGPDEMILAGDQLFVINSGGFGVDSTVSIIQTNDEEPFGLLEVGHRPSGIQKDVNGKIWVLCSGKGWNGFPVSASLLNTQPLISGNTMFYGLGYDKVTKMIFATDPLDYAQNGWVYRFNALDGTPVDSFLVGIIPNGFWFNQ
ncbi:MAG: hypothetical protein M0Q51_07695 [Bacteroidales bacterium]|nr:hypothetical protein [Bacteroidales bacterium]